MAGCSGPDDQAGEYCVGGSGHPPRSPVPGLVSRGVTGDQQSVSGGGTASEPPGSAARPPGDGATSGGAAGDSGTAGGPPEAAASPSRYTVTTYVPPEPTVQFADRRRLTPEEKAAAQEERRKRRKRRRIIGWSMIAAGCLLLLAGGWVAFRAYQAYSNLDAAATRVQELQSEMGGQTAATGIGPIDEPAARQTIADLQADAAAARSAVDDPLYRLATGLPLIGPNLDAVSTVSDTVNSLAQDVMPPLLDVAITLRPENLAPKDGVIPLAPIQQISPTLQNADAAIDQSLVTIGGIDRSALVQPVANAVGRLGDKLVQAADVTDPAARIARLAPAMLGADGPRTWLVVFQNPAEPRATGGIFGSFALIKADQGKIEILDQGASSRAIGQFSQPITELTPTEKGLFGDLPGQFPQDVNLTPDYERAAQLYTDMYKARTGTQVDGVVALDPVVLAYALKGAPAIDVGNGVTLDSGDLVEALLARAYAQFAENDQAARDQFLAASTGRIFSEVMSGKIDSRAVIDGLRQGVREHRVLIQSNNPTEQLDLQNTDLTSQLDGPGASTPTVGVFLNDATAAKLGYYLKPSVAITDGDCRPDGRRLLNVAVTLTSNAPSTATPLPGYVLGDSALGAQHGVLTDVLVTAPVGGGVVSANQEGGGAAFSRGQIDGRETGSAPIQLLPGETKTVTFQVLSPVGSPATDVAPRLVTSPLVSPWTTSVDAYRVCRAEG